MNHLIQKWISEANALEHQAHGLIRTGDSIEASILLLKSATLRECAVALGKLLVKFRLDDATTLEKLNDNTN